MLRISVLQVCDTGICRAGHWRMQSTHQLGREAEKNTLRARASCPVLLWSCCPMLSLLTPFHWPEFHFCQTYRAKMQGKCPYNFCSRGFQDVVRCMSRIWGTFLSIYQWKKHPPITNIIISIHHRVALTCIGWSANQELFSLCVAVEGWQKSVHLV